MRSKKSNSQKNATQRAVKSIPAQTKKRIDERYNPPNPIPTLKDRPKPTPPSQPSKQEPAPSTPSKKD